MWCKLSPTPIYPATCTRQICIIAAVGFATYEFPLHPLRKLRNIALEMRHVTRAGVHVYRHSSQEGGWWCTLLNLSFGSFDVTMGSMVLLLPKVTSGMYRAHTTWAHPAGTTTRKMEYSERVMKIKNLGPELHEIWTQDLLLSRQMLLPIELLDQF